MKKNRGVYVCLEGLDGCGKSTAFSLLIEQLKRNEIQFSTCCPTRAPECKTFLENIFSSWSFLRNSSLARALVYAVRSSYASDHTDWTKTLIVGDRSLITSYVTRWGKILGSIAASIKLVDLLESKIPAPDIVIYLDAPHDLLRERLIMRDRPMDIDESAIRSLEMRAAYEQILTRSTYIKRLSCTKFERVVISREMSPLDVANQVWRIINNAI